MSSPEKKLFLLDAMALIYRAHFAFSKNPRINSKGMNTGAVFGFTNTLLEILQKQKPSHIAVAFDTPAPTFRHLEFPEYKAQRQEVPEDIRTAIPIVKELVRSFRVPVLEAEGYEADDIIGTLALQAVGQGFTVYMMTPDKDYAQLVRENLYLYKPAYMGNAVDILGVKEVLEKFEIERVDQVRDILGLQGDASDNIPGIPGVGAKTAVKLVREYGSVEKLLENTADLPGKLRENVEKYAQQGLLSKRLATIATDAPVPFDEAGMACSGFDEAELRRLFDLLEFRNLAARVLGTPAGGGVSAAGGAQLALFGEEEAAQPEEGIQPPPSPSEKLDIYSTVHEYHLIDTEQEMRSLVRYLGEQSEFCFDTETTSVQAREAELVGLAFSYCRGEAYYVPVPAGRAEAQAIVELFRPVLEDGRIAKTGQNLKYDMLVLRNYGVEVRGPMFDTMLAHFLLEPEGRHSMDAMAEVHLNYLPVSIETLIGKKGSSQGSMRDVQHEKAAEYSGEDADITLQLKSLFAPRLKEKNLESLFYDVEMPLVAVLADMEFEGVRVDPNALTELSATMEGDIARIEQDIYQLAGEHFNIGSPKQLGEVLFDKLRLVEKPKKTKTGQYATGEEILADLADLHPVVERILEYREIQKLKSTYIDALPGMISPADGRIHTSYNQAVAATGRLSSTNPNLQNIPVRTAKGREIRKAFIPRDEGYQLMSADYSQIELRIMASFSEDPGMIEAFRQGRDIHAATASRIFGVPLGEVSDDMRRKAKTANFGIIYGISAFGLSQRLKIPRKEASDIIESYFREFPGVKTYMDRMIAKARGQEYVETILGRRRYLRDINSKNATMRGFAERNAINTPIQGSAADMIKIAMIRIHQWMRSEKLKSRMILQVHDELVFDVHQNEKDIMSQRVAELMKTAIDLAVPMEVGIGFGENWLQAH
jgi:DNA polymerase I